MSVACSSKDDHTPSAGSGGEGGHGAGGGANGGAPAGGGGGTSGGAPGSGAASTSSGGTETGTGGVPPSCAADPNVDGGRTWRDFEEGTCKPCPGTELTECAQFTAAPGPSFDAENKVLTLHVQPGLTEVLGLRLEGRTSVPGNDEFTFVDVDARVSENTVTFDLSNALPPNAQGFFEGLIVGEDACGGAVDTSASRKFEIRFDAAGAVDRIGCVE